MASAGSIYEQGKLGVTQCGGAGCSHLRGGVYTPRSRDREWATHGGVCPSLWSPKRDGLQTRGDENGGQERKGDEENKAVVWILVSTFGTRRVCYVRNASRLVVSQEGV